MGIDAILSVGYATLGNGTELLLLAAVRLFAVILRSGDDMYLPRGSSRSLFVRSLLTNSPLRYLSAANFVSANANLMPTP